MFTLTLVLLFILRLRFPPGSSVRSILITRYGQTGLNSYEFYQRKFLALGNSQSSSVLCGDFNLQGVNWGRIYKITQI